jgi:hypothetical protein
MEFNKAFSTFFRLDEVHKNSYLAVTLNGYHDKEGAYVALRVNDKIVGASDRSISFPANTWEAPVCDQCVFDENFTYYFPVSAHMKQKDIEVVVLGSEACNENLNAEVWITSYPIPFNGKRLILTK